MVSFNIEIFKEQLDSISYAAQQTNSKINVSSINEEKLSVKIIVSNSLVPQVMDISKAFIIGRYFENSEYYRRTNTIPLGK